MTVRVDFKVKWRVGAKPEPLTKQTVRARFSNASVLVKLNRTDFKYISYVARYNWLFGKVYTNCIDLTTHNLIYTLISLIPFVTQVTLPISAALDSLHVLRFFPILKKTQIKFISQVTLPNQSLTLKSFPPPFNTSCQLI